ncbi:MAG: A24 family peptidase [Phycisphaerales bacterium]
MNWLATMPVRLPVLVPLALADRLPGWVYEVTPHAVIGLFVFAFGACLGSFANVVIYRLPEGISVVSPPSRCPTCGVRLKWHENLPIVGWIALRGRCRACGVRISPQYLVIELLMGLLLLWLYLAYFAAPPTMPWWGDVGGPWWFRNGVLRSLPAFLLHAILLAALVAMAKIDVRSFHLPTAVPNTVAIAAFLLWPLQTLLPAPAQSIERWPIPLLSAPWIGAALGAGLGVLASTAALWRGALRPSFADYDDFLPPATSERTAAPVAPASDGPRIELWFLAVVLASTAVGLSLNGARVAAAVVAAAALIVLAAPMVLLRHASSDVEEAALADYPHARREVLREVVFLLPALGGAAVGFLLVRWLATGGGEQVANEASWIGAAHGGVVRAAAAGTIGAINAPGVVAALGASVAGYLVAGGMVWAVRIVATLGFGREAMGLGDVHLFGAVGAVLGWTDPLWAFFAAAFFGLAWAIAATVVGGRGAVQRSSIPFGPHLALAAVGVIAFRPALDRLWGLWLASL